MVQAPSKCKIQITGETFDGWSATLEVLAEDDPKHEVYVTSQGAMLTPAATLIRLQRCSSAEQTHMVRYGRTLDGGDKFLMEAIGEQVELRESMWYLQELISNAERLTGIKARYVGSPVIDCSAY